MSIDAAAFKKGMRHLAASVTLITTKVHRDQRGGLTATAVCSVSAEPPQILVCVNKSASSAHDPIGEGGLFLRQHPLPGAIASSPSVSPAWTGSRATSGSTGHGRVDER
jgi:hypothetical protein